MLSYEQVSYNNKFLPELRALYRRSFPAKERGPLNPLLRNDFGTCDTLVFSDDDVFVGFVCLLTYLDITHILYFAVNDKLRNKGYGSAMLSAVIGFKKKYRIIADLEDIVLDSDNVEQRENRCNFYKKNCFQPTDITYRWKYESFRIYSYGNTVSRSEFDDFWRNFYKGGKRVSDY